MATLITKNSSTASSVPTAAQLVQGELAVNVTDKRLFTENSSGTVVELGTNPSTLALPNGSANGVAYLNGSKVLTTGSALTFDGAQLGVNGITVGRGAGAVSTNTAVGASALSSGSLSGAYNTAVGNLSLQGNTTGARNSAFGHQALNANTTGTQGSAFGSQALVNNTTGNYNTGIGEETLYSNTTASNNTAVGYQAAYTNTTGTRLTAMGVQAGKAYNNASGNYGDTFVGAYAGTSVTTGYDNAFLGGQAGYSTTSGINNTAVGTAALYSNTTAAYNTAVGYQAGYSNTVGANNTYIGWASGNAATGGKNTFVGETSGYYVTTGANNTILGRYNGNQGGLDIRTSNNYIVLSDGAGNPRLHFDGATWYTFTLGAGAGTNALKFNTTTGAWTYDTSSARYKDNIRDSVYGLRHVMQMRSAQFEYKDTGRSDVGFIAEELDPIIPELVMKNKDGQPDAVSYDRMVSVLVKAIQELKADLDATKAELAALKGA